MKKSKIKILSPIDNFKEAEELIKFGVDEFYCGLFLEKNTYNSKRCDDLKRENISNSEELKKIVQLMKRKKKSIYIVFNDQTIKRTNFSKIKNKIFELKKMGVSGFIISSIDFLEYLKNEKLKLISSSFLETKNYETVNFINKFNVKRVIIDRQIGLDDIRCIKRKFKNIEIEVFIMEVGCRSLDGFCGREVLDSKSHNHICMGSFNVENRNLSKTINLGIIEKLRMSNKSCGACSMYDFNLLHVDSVKIVGRGFSMKRKYENAKFIVKTRDLLNKKLSKKEFFQNVQNYFFEIYGYKCTKSMCYYPHFFNK